MTGSLLMNKQTNLKQNMDSIHTKEHPWSKWWLLYFCQDETGHGKYTWRFNLAGRVWVTINRNLCLPSGHWGCHWRGSLFLNIEQESFLPFLNFPWVVQFELSCSWVAQDCHNESGSGYTQLLPENLTGDFRISLSLEYIFLPLAYWLSWWMLWLSRCFLPSCVRSRMSWILNWFWKGNLTYITAKVHKFKRQLDF